MKRKSKRVQWKKAAIALAHCAQFAIRYRKHLGSGTGVRVHIHPKTGKPENKGPWEDMFFDALDQVGVVYDRKAYYAGQSKSEKRRRSPAAIGGGL